MRRKHDEKGQKERRHGQEIIKVFFIESSTLKVDPLYSEMNATFMDPFKVLCVA